MLCLQRSASRTAPRSNVRSINPRRFSDGDPAFVPTHVHAPTPQLPSRLREVNFFAPAE